MGFGKERMVALVLPAEIWLQFSSIPTWNDCKAFTSTFFATAMSCHIAEVNHYRKRDYQVGQSTSRYLAPILCSSYFK